ncbi:MAG TPA: hypothetical protein VF599_02945, partial [Pyrinomonadaceae bacterium]
EMILIFPMKNMRKIVSIAYSILVLIRTLSAVFVSGSLSGFDSNNGKQSAFSRAPRKISGFRIPPPRVCSRWSFSLAIFTDTHQTPAPK